MKIKLLILIAIIAAMCLPFYVAISADRLLGNENVVIVQTAPGNGYEVTRNVCNGQLYECCKKGALSSICDLDDMTPSYSSCSTATNEFKEDVDCDKVAPPPTPF